jgi:hypothetical protein
MVEGVLNDPQIDASFQEVRRVRMPYSGSGIGGTGLTRFAGGRRSTVRIDARSLVLRPILILDPDPLLRSRAKAWNGPSLSHGSEP